MIKAKDLIKRLQELDPEDNIATMENSNDPLSQVIKNPKILKTNWKVAGSETITYIIGKDDKQH
jgi:hypothetical protein